MFSREIGRVVGVDSFRVIIELDDSIKGTHKSGYHDIYEVAKINSYVILPIGNEKIVALITRVKSFEENDFEKTSGEISLPKAKRHLIATMIGTISNENYIEGIYNYPILDNPVWYIIKDDLSKIFDDKKKEEVDFENDFYLPIGKASNFFDYNVKINPDKFFCKHSAILGNTGSGKSCTVTSILQTLFKHEYGKEGKLKSSNIIIFDTNGEYKETFKDNENINSFNITEEGLKVPYWFMNYEDFEHIFEPSAGTQAPILKSALGILKNEVQIKGREENIDSSCISWFKKIKDSCEKYPNSPNDLNKFVYFQIESVIELFEKNGSLVMLKEMKKLESEKSKLSLKANGWVNGSLSAILIDEILKKLNSFFEKYSKGKVKNIENIDRPKYFNFLDLVTKGLDLVITDLGESQGKNRENISALKLRLSSFISDDRKSEPLMIKKENIHGALVSFISYLFGNPLEGENVFSEYRKNTLGDEKKDKKSQITIIDLSLLPYELLETVTGLIGRLILEFTQRINKVNDYKEERGNVPIAIVLEEAQNYIPEVDYNGKKSIAKKIFERIAREGRKYGVSLIISSQRPSELSKTILSQCNTFIVHRLQNPEDQRYIKQIVSSANSDLLNQLPVLPQQHAIIMGEAVRSPIQLKINEIKNKPDSSNPKYIENWLKEKNEIEIEKVVEQWLKN